jgi:gliding motility-associated-like protein
MLLAQSIIPASDYAPNLDLASGDFTNWKCYSGTYYCDNDASDRADRTYSYGPWVPMAAGSERIKVMGEMSTIDPIVRETSQALYVNPYPGKSVARIGVPGQREGHDKYAAVDKLEYTFTVANETTVLKYCFATVLHIASFGNHADAEVPVFSINVSVKKPDGTIAVPNCSAYSTIVDEDAADLLDVNDCHSPLSGVTPSEYKFHPWTFALVDLRQYKGCEVTISIMVRDCLADGTGRPLAGSHEAYAYFRAEAMDLSLSTLVCNTEDPQIAAPEGFAGYQWSRSNNFPLTETGNVLTLPYGEMVPGITYTCVLSDEIGCAAIALDTQLDPVVVEPAFTYEAKCDGLVEFTSQSTVSGDDMVNWIWNAGEGESSGNISNHVYDEPGEYEVKLTAVTANGCQQSITQTITVPYFPDLKINAPGKVCEGKEIQVSVVNAENGSDITWTTNAPNVSLPQQVRAFPIVPEQSQTYKVEVTDPRGCTYYATRDVVLFDKAHVYIDGEKATCPGEGVELTLVGENLSDVVWNVPGANLPTVTVYPNENTTYRVTASDANECVVEAEHNMEVYPRPEFTVEVPTVCEGEDAVITATGAASYQWDGIAGATTGGTQVIPQVTVGGEYTVTGYSDKGCSNQQTYAVNVTPIPVVEIQGDVERCFDGEPFEITAHGADTYQWNGVEGDNTFTAVSDRNHDITLVGMVGTCQSEPLEIKLTTLDKPTVVSAEATYDVCQGDELPLQVSGAESYQWTGSTEVGGTLTVSPAENQVYTVKGIAANGCVSDPLEIPVNVHQADALMLHIDQHIACPTKPDSAVLIATGASQYQWMSVPDMSGIDTYTGDILAFSYETPTTVIVKGTNEFGCTAQAQVELALLPDPEFTFQVSPKMIEVGASDVHFTGVAPANIVSWFWNPGDGSVLLNARDTIHTYSMDYIAEPFTVEVTAIDEHGCRYHGETEIKIWKDIKAPTGFTPNNDGLNDVFQFYGLDNIETFDFYIYNRLGEVVFEGTSVDDTWDGTYQGQPCPWGVYGWVAHYTANVEGELREDTIKGHVSIVK